MKNFIPVLLVTLFACSTSEKQAESQTTTEPHEQAVVEIADETLSLMANGLRESIRGNWITTEFTDSIFVNNKIQPWKNVFYGNLYLVIDDSDTAYWNGNMDGGPFNLVVHNPTKFDLVQEWGKASFKYSPKNDLISLGSSKTFKRVNDSDIIEMILDESQLQQYIIDKLFTDYLSDTLFSRVRYISLGIETFTPFEFDAIGLKITEGGLDYYGWEIVNDTLKLYNTSSTEDLNSGFSYFHLEELDTVFVKNN